MDPVGWARLLTGAAAFVKAIGGLFGRGGEAAEPERPTEAELLNQRQEQSAGAARNYSSRRTELAARAKASK